MHTSNIEHEWFVPGKLLWASPMRGVEVTELADGGYYFAPPPGDFSKVDFSACQKQEIDPWVMAGIRAGASMQAFSGWAITGFLDPNTLPSKADTSPKTAQHSKQAKPALPSLMTEAGEKYQGLGWCDE